VKALLGALIMVAVAAAWWREDAEDWRFYQAGARRIQAEQAAVALHAADSEEARLAAQASLADASSARPAVIAVIPSRTGKPEVCLTCHLGIEEISPSHPVQAFGCVVCHGGEPLSLDKTTAHQGLRGGPNPSSLDVAAQSCGQADCHGGYAEEGPGNRNMVERVTRSLQATYAPAIALVNFTFGGQRTLTPTMGIQAVIARGAVRPPALDRLAALPPTGQTTGSALERFARSCLDGGCHLWTEARQSDRFYRGDGCAACHAPYAADGRYAGGDATTPRAEAGHASAHRLSTAIPYNTCDSCHNRGNYDVATLTFAPRTDLDGSAPSALTGQQQRFKEYYQPIGAFTRCEWVLDCIDCHTPNQVMGNGAIYGRVKDSQTTECRTCHGTLTETAAVSPAGDVEVRLARVSGAYKVSAGDLLATTPNGDRLGNVQRIGGAYVLTTKVKGQQYAVPQVAGSACEQKAEEQGSADCHACHAVER
jgi:hypothetical protein